MTLRALYAIAALCLPVGCGSAGAPATARAILGVDRVPAIHLYENHSSSLVAWRKAGVHDRILVHVDGHADLDWLPDATIARLAAAEPEELAQAELHPYALDGTTHRRFGIWNFVYPAARLGIVREYVWVVPDGTLGDPGRAQAFVRGLVLAKMQGIGLQEARSLRLEGRVVRGTLLGLPTTICELADLPAFDERVLLDVDLDFFTTRSAATQEITDRPWLDPAGLVERLRARGLQADVATVSYSTYGGYVPPSCRWLGRAMTDALEGAVEDAAARAAAFSGAPRFHDLTARYPDDASAWYGLARAEERAGRLAEAETARRRAIVIDPIFLDAPLFEADALWTNGAYAEALEAYRAYRRGRPIGPFGAYALRREASCLARLGRDREAIVALRRVVAAAPAHADSWLDLGVLLRETGDRAGALAAFREARRILPEQAAYAMALGTTYALEGRLDLALVEMLAAADLRPSWAHARLNAGALLLDAGRLDEAAEHLDAAAFLEPGHPQLQRILARVPGGGAGLTRTAARAAPR